MAVGTPEHYAPSCKTCPRSSRSGGGMACMLGAKILHALSRICLLQYRACSIRIDPASVDLQLRPPLPGCSSGYSISLSPYFRCISCIHAVHLRREGLNCHVPGRLALMRWWAVTAMTSSAPTSVHLKHDIMRKLLLMVRHCRC